MEFTFKELKELAYCLQTYGPTDWLHAYLTKDGNDCTDSEEQTLGIEFGKAVVNFTEQMERLFVDFAETRFKEYFEKIGMKNQSKGDS